MDRAQTPAPTVRTEMRGVAFWVILDRPDVLNSLDRRMVDDIGAALDDAERRMPRPAAIVITGAGRAFCAGGDLAELRGADGAFATGAPLFGAIAAALTRLEALDLPVIAAVNGLAVAGGLEIALAADLVVADEAARFGDGHANFGLLPGGGGSVRLTRKIGPGRAALMMMTGRLFDAATMERWGLVALLAPAGTLDTTVADLVADLSAKSPLGLARMKAMIAAAADAPLATALANEQAVCALHDHSYDRNEGLAAFAAKRAPRFEAR